MENWLEAETSGSPFVIMDRKYLKDWNSIKDYEKIYSIKDYIGIINLQNINIMVFGDESMPLKIIKKDNLIIIRWVYGENETAVDKIIETIDYKMLPIIENISTEFNSTELVLFDSILAYDEIENNYIGIRIPDKKCIVKTSEYKNTDTHLIIHTIS